MNTKQKPTIGYTTENCIASDLQKQLRKILGRYSKDLELYLEMAEEPATTNKLFTQNEIRGFIDKQKILPLEKLVILSAIMERCLTLRFTGKCTASLPLTSTANADDFLAQLHHVYNVLALLTEDSHPGTKSHRAAETVHPDPTDETDMGLVDAIDLATVDALVAAAYHGGFNLHIVLQHTT